MSAYQASREDELSFVRGAVVKVLKKFVDGWWLVRSVQNIARVVVHSPTRKSVVVWTY